MGSPLYNPVQRAEMTSAQLLDEDKGRSGKRAREVLVGIWSKEHLAQRYLYYLAPAVEVVVIGS